MKHHPAIFRSILCAALVFAAPVLLLSGPGSDDPGIAPQAAAAGPATLSAGNMVVEFDGANGVIRSITEKQGRFGTNYLGNPDTAPGTSPADGFWTGNIVSTAWELELPERPVVLIPSFSFRPSGKWRAESTGHSADIRKTSFDGRTFRVEYVGPSANEGGLKSYNLRMAYHFDEERLPVLGYRNRKHDREASRNRGIRVPPGAQRQLPERPDEEPLYEHRG